MNIGIDVHGVIDADYELWARLTKDWREQGHKIHIVTGQERKLVEPELIANKIQFDEFFSIVDSEVKKGTHTWTRSDKKGRWMDRDIWMRAKGDYAAMANLHVHFDDTAAYGEFFPMSCVFICCRGISYNIMHLQDLGWGGPFHPTH